jgi:hypothetical protein
MVGLLLAGLGLMVMVGVVVVVVVAVVANSRPTPPPPPAPPPSPRELLIGTWEPENKNGMDNLTLEFTRDRRVRVWANLDPPGVRGGNPPVQVTGSYRFVDDGTIVVNFENGPNEDTIRFSVTRQRLTLTPTRDNIPQSFRRVWK